jgi:hypothetical protein
VERDGVVLALTDVTRAGPVVSATMVYEVEGRSFRQPFVARVLSRDELSTELDHAGLRLQRHLTPTWTQAVAVVPDAPG